MTEHEIHQLAQDYIGYFALGAEAQDAQFKAVEKLWKLCREDPSIGFRVIWVAVNLVNADNLKALSFLGTGPLEDLIKFHGNEYLNLMIEAARENANFCVALSCVWRHAVSENAWAELSGAMPQIRASHGRMQPA
ncbi:DUF6869 domain-containing protein [Kordiimonas lipolytica]|uniref:DUF6869 domain-containing protein n=1 Tax=Kordiimonas lipolytica TaxID=1662421 RepID=A0ABV8UBS8_9PROT|nr:hypothetical protein [Kordiimonas lipolytica]